MAVRCRESLYATVLRSLVCLCVCLFSVASSVRPALGNNASGGSGEDVDFSRGREKFRVEEVNKFDVSRQPYAKNAPRSNRKPKPIRHAHVTKHGFGKERERQSGRHRGSIAGGSNVLPEIENGRSISPARFGRRKAGKPQAHRQARRQRDRVDDGPIPSMPISKVANAGTRISAAQLFDDDARRRGKAYRSGRETPTYTEDMGKMMGLL